MEWLVFAQADAARLDVVRLLRHARSFFALSVDVLEQRVEPEDAGRVATRLDVTWTERSERATFRVIERRATVQDVARARLAESRCRGGGLGDLAARCPLIWELQAEGDAPEPLRLALAALLASVALGPILPPDGSAIYGVRGARERVEALTGGRHSTR